MKKALVLALAGILASGFVAVAGLAGAAEYDRYERGTAAPPPPRRSGRPGSTRGRTCSETSASSNPTIITTITTGRMDCRDTPRISAATSGSAPA